MERPTFVLTERVCSPLSLTVDDLVFLHEQHPHLALVPTPRRGLWLVTPRNRVGVILAPSCRLVIQPKLPFANVWYLLDPDSELPTVLDGSSPSAADGFVDLLTRVFEQCLRTRVAAGLARAYAERSGQGGILQGRPDIAAQLRDNPLHKDRLHWRCDDLTVDVPCNQAVRATLDLLLDSELPSDEVRRSLRAFLPTFAEIQPLMPTSRIDRLDLLGHPAEYGPLLEICRLLLEGLTPNERGARSGASFLLDLERVWERYVIRCVRLAFDTVADATVQVKADYHIVGATPEQPDLQMRPDAVVEQRGGPCLVVDAKWKRPRGGRLIRTDVYQALAYAVGVQAARTVLVYPGRRDLHHVYHPKGSEGILEVCRLRAVGSAAACDRSRRRLGRQLRQSRAIPDDD
jgi:5-methylcytosine-specific restriction enzyme subunit McrC